MFYLFRNSACFCLCEEKKRLEDMKEDGDVILEHKQWLQPSDLSISPDGESIIVKEITQTGAETQEQKLAIVRRKRNKLLLDSDWTDTLSAKSRLGDTLYNAWQSYRQALRDITDTTDVDTIVFPIAPSDSK